MSPLQTLARLFSSDDTRFVFLGKSRNLPRHMHILRLTPRSRKPQRGQGVVEYVALTALIGVASVATLKTLGSKVNDHLHRVTETFDRNLQEGLKGAARAKVARRTPRNRTPLLNLDVDHHEEP